MKEYCSECGHNIATHWRYCDACGHPIVRVTTVTVVMTITVGGKVLQHREVLQDQKQIREVVLALQK